MHQWQKWLINSSMLIPMGLIRSSTCAFSSLSIVIVIISVLPISIGSYANFLIHLQSTRLLAACKMSLQTLFRCWGNFSATLFMILILSYQGTLHSATFYSVELTLTISIDYSFTQRKKADGKYSSIDLIESLARDFLQSHFKTTCRCFGNYIMHQGDKQS